MGKFMKSQPCLVVILSPQKIAEERTKDTLQKAKSGLLVDGPRLTRWTVFFFPQKNCRSRPTFYFGFKEPATCIERCDLNEPKM
jgi:hypothetical protein